MHSRRNNILSSIAVTLLIGAAGIVLGAGRHKPMRSSRLAEPVEPEDIVTTPEMRKPAPMQIRRLAVFIVLALVLFLGAGIYGGYQFKFSREARARAIALTTGDPDFGRRLTLRYGCAGCHMIPGVPGADGKVGPSLEGLASRIYIGGVATNNPDTLVQWIENPRSIDPKTAMPITGISRAEARHVAAYLYTLR